MHLTSHFTFNLAPADVRKEGSLYDLPMPIAVLSATKQIIGNYKEAVFIGELSLSGKLRPVSGVLSMVLSSLPIPFRGRCTSPSALRRRERHTPGRLQSPAYR